MRITVLLLLLVGLFSQVCFAHGSKPAPDLNQRYTGYRESPPSAGQLNPLNAPMSRISSKSLTISRAIKDVLVGTGYVLAQEFSTDPKVTALLDARLPLQQRTLDNLSVREALMILAGDPWQLALDPVHRLVSFELPISYQDEPVHTYRKPHNGMVLLGFDNTVAEEPTPFFPPALTVYCKTLSLIHI